MRLVRLRVGPEKIWPGLVVGFVLIGTTFELRLQGRRWWCACGRPNLWSGNVWSEHNSQHFLDPYSFTHVLHGFLWCWLFLWLLTRLPTAWQLCVGIIVESLWEIVENTNYVIERYRDVTAAVGYEGDSIANSLGGASLLWRAGSK
jgi:hypothetical protein